MEAQHQRTHDKGETQATHWHCNGILIGHAVSTFRELSSFGGSSQEDVVRFHFGLKGDYRFYYKQLDKHYDLVGGHHNIMYSRGFDITVYNKTLRLETFGIQFPRDLFVQFTQNASEPLQRFAADIMAGRHVMLSEQWGAIDTPIQQVIQQILHCRYAGDLRQLFLLSKSIELLVLCAESYQLANSRKDAFIRNKTDKEKIIAARDLVNERLHCPPNLSEIARAVGLNEYKLKRGFKETFHNTVFGYLTEQRLQLAHQYLRDTQKSAAEISAELGYATPQHFNNAFKKKFGVTPFLVRNNP
ncbi:helix-turn-helix transcriptional regulator [Chitinophaga japonensis]|uniref:AraC-like DNA-binding protein n=1 Tax=Chitinophaga japonensis TaxID=104662 RepID=A0A562TEX1_CHIJA|nr:AraC family transcriptional regulator [Chitinophaga japonensis]TWI92081.1 AraC-like DNA-binding protein [Chitinophaga japonensis]